MPRLMPPLTALRAPSARRDGFTLVEMLVTLVILGLVMGTVLRLLDRQQRFYRSANEIVDARSQLRQAASILPSDIRGVSTIGRDVIAIAPTSVTLLANFGSAVVCSRQDASGGATASDRYFAVPPLNGVKNIYTSWVRKPAAGDSVFVLDEGTKRGSEDDEWLRFAVDSVEESTSYCATSTALTSTLYTHVSESAKPRYRVKVKLPGAKRANTADVTAIPTTVINGAGVRFGQPVEYKLYQPTGDTRWFLGIREFRGGSWSTVAPVSGPYRGTASGAAPAGLSFRYYNDQGVEVATTASAATVATIARIDMMVRTLGTDKTNVISRGDESAFEDSLAARVAVRNRH